VTVEGFAMIGQQRHHVDYDESGIGPTVVLVPGSCSTGAAWRPVIGAWNNQFRAVTTSLPGYGETAERRTASDPSIDHAGEAVEAVVRRTGGAVHLVGHSFGGLVALAVALRGRVALESLTIIEAPAVMALQEPEEAQHHRAFRQMSDAYFAAFENGEPEAVERMIDFYGGAGCFAALPARVRAYAMATTATNIMDWVSAYGFPLMAESLAKVQLPTLVLLGAASNPAVQRANELLSERIGGARREAIEGAMHFMITTHAEEVAHSIAAHVYRSRATLKSMSTDQTSPHLPAG
jgi:pimeloyl-ACP methyl ester carboxylesterase